MLCLLGLGMNFIGRICHGESSPKTELVAQLMDSETEADVDFVLDFDTATLSNGVYFCKVTNGSETHTNRLIVTH
ncbi:MAG: T9SS type A sorting domain-containing protein [Flavobacteriales bacterium]|nr:T9SS type A sorting domain-containing protein [Flavobacteriales bacterium]